MTAWIIGVIAYILIGVGILIWSVLSDPWGGLVLEIWWMVVLFYPVLMLLSLYQYLKG
jgi:hypothetical protein